MIEPSSLEVNHYTVDLFNGTDDSVKLRIALIADFHVASSGDSFFLERVVSLVNEVDADYVVICGDLINYEEEEISLLTPLLNLRDRNHTLVVLGNHDYGRGWSQVHLADRLVRWLELNNFTVLRNGEPCLSER